jgi:chorismate mutase / prephenate dehydrogenase
VTLDDLRVELAAVDREILRLAARRRELAARVGAVKTREGRAIQDPGQEEAVLRRAREEARALDLPPALAEAIMRLLIDSALTVQEEGRVRARGAGQGRRALVIGGAGRMGGWFVRFLRLQRWTVEVADPAAGPADPDVPRHDDWRAVPLDHDLIVVAAPLRASAAILTELARHRPPGVVCDIGSLKSPLRDALEGLARAGVKVASLHPMFGPDTRLLSGRHVIVTDLGCPAATRLVEDLFAPTLATVVRLDLADHDRMVAFVLGLSHALNIAFFTALAGSGETARHLRKVSSTTFAHQLAVARRVAAENPHLYYEIQRLNDHGALALGALEDAVRRLRTAVLGGDEEAFVRLMEEGRAFLEGEGGDGTVGRESSAA